MLSMRSRPPLFRTYSKTKARIKRFAFGCRVARPARRFTRSPFSCANMRPRCPTPPPRVQIFATDIDEPALTVARAARYPEALLDGVSAERRERFFVNDGGSYVVNKAVREMCTFSPHSVIRDPPFSRIDLISCRNLLIYFGPEIQSTAIPTFHYSLRPGGYLFLGTSEGLGQHPHLFAMLDKKNRIFQRRAHEPARLPTGISSALSRFPV